MEFHLGDILIGFSIGMFLGIQYTKTAISIKINKAIDDPSEVLKKMSVREFNELKIRYDNAFDQESRRRNL
jgi:hypothetical protein